MLENLMNKLSRKLTVRELLEKTYDNLGKRNPHREIILPERVLALIADDSNGHRTRCGYMSYKDVKLFKFGSKTLVVGRGESWGDYPARHYDSDLLVLELPADGKPLEEIQKELRTEITRSIFFENSLLYGRREDGLLAIPPNNRFSKKMQKLLVPKMSDFIAQTPEYCRDLIKVQSTSSSFALYNPATKIAYYKSKAVDLLTTTIEEILRKY